MSGKPRTDRSGVASIHLGIRLSPRDHAALRTLQGRARSRPLSPTMVIRELIWKAIAERGDDGERQVADHLRRWAIANGAAQLPPSPVPPTLRIAIRDASGNSYVIRFRFVPRVRAPFQRYFPGRTALAVRAVDRATLELLREPDLATLKYEFEGKPYETREALLVAIEDRESEWRLR